MGDPVVDLAILLWKYETNHKDLNITPDSFRSLERSACEGCRTGPHCDSCKAKSAYRKAEWIHAQQLAPQR